MGNMEHFEFSLYGSGVPRLLDMIKAMSEDVRTVSIVENYILITIFCDHSYPPPPKHGPGPMGPGPIKKEFVDFW